MHTKQKKIELEKLQTLNCPKLYISLKKSPVNEVRRKMVNKRCPNPVFNLFILSAPFLYLLKTSENSKVFWCFQGLEKECISNEWDKLLQA